MSHRTRVKSVIKHFCQWLIDEKELLKRNPTTGIEIKAQQQLAPRVLEPDQRFVLRNLVEKAGGYCLSWWWINRSTSANTLRAGFFVMGQSEQATSS